MSNIDNMIASIINKDKSGFTDSFSSEMKERLASSIIDKNLNISANIIGSSNSECKDCEEVEEAKEYSISYKFKSTKNTKDFITALTNMGIKNPNISQRGNVVSVKILRKDTLQMIQAIAKDLKASIIKEENDIISALMLSHLTDSVVNFTLKDSSSIHILPEEAINITKIHDNLNKDNQIKMRELLSENKDSFNKIVNFCNTK
jgi:hypothetical protein